MSAGGQVKRLSAAGLTSDDIDELSVTVRHVSASTSSTHASLTTLPDGQIG